MKKLLSMVGIAAAGVFALGSAAHATLTPTDGLFFTAPADGTLTFTYEGFSAADKDTMTFDFNGATIFTNGGKPVLGPPPASTPGDTVTELVKKGGLYQLTLTDLTVAATWHSDPAANSDGKAHLKYTDTFSDFDLGAAPFPVTGNCAAGGGLACYLGWEDRKNPGADGDFNDLVFAEQFFPSVTPPGVPEPASMTLLGSGLIALGMVMRRRRRKAT
jgi:hypothetical protein